MKNKLIPEIRFERFTDDWEQRKLGDLSQIIDPHPSHRAPAEVTEGIPFIGIGDVDEEGNIYYRSVRLVSEKIYDEHHKRYNLSKNSIGIGRVASLGKIIRLRNDIGKYAVSPTMAVIQFNDNIDSDFMYATMSNPNFQKQFKSLSNGSTRQSVGIQDLRSLEISISTNVDEQLQIGILFKNLDHSITLHQRKLDLVKEQKKGYLQKMFPKNGEKVPELRFAGFADDWEERKLKELGEIQTGNTPPTSDSDNYSLDGVLWVTPTDIKSLVISNTAKKLSQVGVTKARIAKAGSILVTSIASIGKNTLLRMDAGFNQQINSLTPTSENDSYFLLTQSEKWSEKMKQTAASATMQIVNKTDFSNISTYVPVRKEEQEKIGSFFKQLDETIALHQRKLDLLKEQKKGFLQKMFV